MKKRTVFDFFENYPFSSFESKEEYFKTDRYIDDEINISPFILYFLGNNYSYTTYNGFSGFYGF